MMLAKDIMNRKVFTGAPVVDQKGRLLGVISQTDLVCRSRVPACERTPAFYR